MAGEDYKNNNKKKRKAERVKRQNNNGFDNDSRSFKTKP